MRSIKPNLMLGIVFALVAGGASAQDESQRIMREQDQQRNNWYWHQMEQDAASSQQQLPPPPPRPTGEWIKTWGALANGSNGEGGASVGKFSKQEAEADAVLQCKRGGGLDCAPTFSYQNQCVAVTQATATSSRSIERASKLALNDCQKKGRSDCDIVYSACTEPYFKSYN